MAGDDKRPLTVGQRQVSEEEAFSYSVVPEQGAPQTTKMPPSEAARPQLSGAGKLPDAPLEDELLHSDDEGETGEKEPER